MPAANMTATDKSAALVGEAIKLKDGAKFDIAFGQMTARHATVVIRAADRDFISIRGIPTSAGPRLATSYLHPTRQVAGRPF